MAQAETRLRHCSAEIYGFAFYHLYACVQIITGLIVRTKLNNHQIVLSIKHDSWSSESVLTLQSAATRRVTVSGCKAEM